MKTENVLILLGVGFIGYWLLKKRQNIIDVNTPISKSEEPKTIILDLSNKKNTRMSMKKSFYDDFRGTGYNTSKFATVSPPTVTVKNTNF